jgi:xanthine dehydrogenase YagS FAD-binding subunit
MIAFSYERPATTAEAIAMARSQSQAKYLGGGTNLIDLMRETIEEPRSLVDVTGLSDEIDISGASILIGAGVKNTAVAANRAIRERYPALARAILTGASAQIRNMATVGGNILQRTRCSYFYDDAAHCNKRKIGSGCDAFDGLNRNHAILGASPACVATHPSDMCVALAAFDAVIHLKGPEGERTVKLVDFHRLPQGRPDVETELKPGELITAVELPPLPMGRRSAYRKVRDRASYAFALVSVAAALEVDEGGKVRDVRLALGGVAHKPWRAWTAEGVLRGRAATRDNFREAAEAALKDAAGLQHNTFKIELAKRIIVSTFVDLSRRHSL